MLGEVVNRNVVALKGPRGNVTRSLIPLPSGDGGGLPFFPFSLFLSLDRFSPGGKSQGGADYVCREN